MSEEVGILDYHEISYTKETGEKNYILMEEKSNKYDKQIIETDIHTDRQTDTDTDTDGHTQTDRQTYTDR